MGRLSTTECTYLPTYLCCLATFFIFFPNVHNISDATVQKFLSKA